MSIRSILLSSIILIHATSAVAEQPSTSSEWSKHTDVDKLRNTEKASYTNFAQNRAWCNGDHELVSLSVSCDADGVTTSLYSGGCLFDTGASSEYRIDNDPNGFIFTPSTQSGKMAFLLEDGPFEKGMLGAPNLLARLLESETFLIEPSFFRAGKQIMEFNTKGLLDVADEEFASCVRAHAEHYKPAPPPAPVDHGTDPLDQLLLGNLACEASPQPYAVFAKLKDLGMLQTEEGYGSDGVGCHALNPPYVKNGVTFDYICGFDEDNTNNEFFSRGPGTSPGHFVELLSSTATQDVLSKWFKETVSPTPHRVSVSKSSLYFSDGYKEYSSVQCNHWMPNLE